MVGTSFIKKAASIAASVMDFGLRQVGRIFIETAEFVDKIRTEGSCSDDELLYKYISADIDAKSEMSPEEFFESLTSPDQRRLLVLFARQQQLATPTDDRFHKRYGNQRRRPVPHVGNMRGWMDPYPDLDAPADEEIKKGKPEDAAPIFITDFTVSGNTEVHITIADDMDMEKATEITRTVFEHFLAIYGDFQTADGSLDREQHLGTMLNAVKDVAPSMISQADDKLRIDVAMLPEEGVEEFCDALRSVLIDKVEPVEEDEEESAEPAVLAESNKVADKVLDPWGKA